MYNGWGEVCSRPQRGSLSVRHQPGFCCKMEKVASHARCACTWPLAEGGGGNWV